MLEVPRKIAKYIYKNYLVNKANHGYRGIILTFRILHPTSTHRKRVVLKHW